MRLKDARPEVKNALSSIQTCSADTVQKTQLLLAGAQALVVDANGVSGKSLKSAKASKTKTSISKATKPSAKGGEAVAIQEDHDVQLSAHERCAFATEIINVALQTLTAATKSSVPSPSNGVAESPHSLSPTSACLKIRSENLSTFPARISKSCAPLRSAGSHGIDAVAQCCSLAFECLRKEQPGVPGKRDASNWQLEHGMSAFIGKLVTLKLTDLATKEMVLLKRRLVTRLGTTAVKSCTTSARLAKSTETLASLLHFDDLGLEDTNLNHIVGFQVLVLKLISVHRRPAVIEEVLQYIKLSSVSSPVNFMLSLSTRSQLQDRMASQLEGMAQIILAFCPKLTPNIDAVARDRTVSPSPDICFQLQSLGFEIHILWRQLAHHTGDIDAEILKPFQRCLIAYARRSGSTAGEKYRLGSCEYSALREQLTKGTEDVHKKSTAGTTSGLDIALHLSHLAQDANLLKESKNWAEVSAQTSVILCSEARRCALVARLATLTLRESMDASKFVDVGQTLGHAVTLLNSGLTGNVADLQTLLREAMSLRHATFLLWKARILDHEFQQDSELVTLCRSIFNSCVRLLNKCLRISANANGNSDSRQHEFLLGVLKAMRPSIECVVLCYHDQVCGDMAMWTAMDAAFSDCSILMNHVTDTKLTNDSIGSILGDGKASLHVRLSNAYWSVFARSKATKVADDIALKSLQRSCECLASQSQDVKNAGFLSMKLMKLGRVLRSLRRHEDANQSFLQSIRIEISGGALRSASSAAHCSTLEAIWKNKQDLGQLGQTVEKMLDFTASESIQLCDGVPFYDDISLSDDERSVLLEFQLAQLSFGASFKGCCSPKTKIMAHLSALLLGLYEETTYPLRRKRMALRVLRLNASFTRLVDPIVAKEAETCALRWPIEDFSKDANLAKYSQHFKASLLAMLACGLTDSQTEGLQEALSVWKGIVDQEDRTCISSNDVDDYDQWLAQLHSISDYLESQGLSFLKLTTVKLILRAYELQPTTLPKALGLARISVGLQLLRCGCSEEVGLYLAKAREFLKASEADVGYQMACHIAHVEYYLALGDLVKCREQLQLARALGAFELRSVRERHADQADAGMIAITKLADALHVQSQFLWETGPQYEALYHARQHVTMLQRAWKALENRQNLNTDAHLKPSFSSSVDSVGDALAKLTMPSDSSDETHIEENLRSIGSQFWLLAPRLYQALVTVAAMFDHFGMFQDAVHHLEQAERLAHSSGSTVFVAATLARRGNYVSRSGGLAEGQRFLDQAAEKYDVLDQSFDHVLYHRFCGNLFRLQTQWDMELNEYKLAESVMDTLMSPKPLSKPRAHVKQLPRTDPPVRKTPGARPLKSSRTKETVIKARKIHVSEVKEHIEPTSPSKTLQRCTKLRAMKEELLRLEAEVLLSQGDMKKAMELLSRIDLKCGPSEMVVEQRGAVARALVRASLQEMSTHAIYSMLPESTVSFPAVVSRRTRGSSSIPCTPFNQSGSPKKPHSPSSTLKRHAAKPRLSFVELLAQASEHASETRTAAIRVGSNIALSQSASAFATASMLMSFVRPEVVGTLLHPAVVAHSIDLPLSAASARERAATDLDILKHQMGSVESWPDHTNLRNMTESLSVSSFQHDLIDMIPEEWATISLSLDETQDHLYVVRYEAHQCPFILRLPLARQNGDNTDEETFTFFEARAELRDIIKTSDNTVHAAQENTDKMKVKGAKTKWWTQREALDNRLRDLLHNIENVWLGGFRGIFSQHQRHPELLARFQQSFENILEKHLPSRQKVRKRTESGKVVLSPRIFDLFVGLGDPSEDGVDLDEALIDMLYYVADILQFNGECNAYDEIDFDSIIIETQDALTSYHEAVRNEGQTSPIRHTILILDKQLHAFPWESMDCLSGQSVSRLPSLSDLRERIFMMREQQQTYSSIVQRAPGIQVAATKGTYILNPSSDLSRTQLRFQKPLSSLAEASWTALVNRTPAEEEFASALTPSDADDSSTTANILLFFGHGSGAQYIRSRRIKRLRQALIRAFSTSTPSLAIAPAQSQAKGKITCNAALLFGCSSASLQEAGEYNPYGTPSTYLIAGAPAVLGSLWDVTDGDVDAFAGEVLEGWGLLPLGTFQAKTGKGKGAKSGGEVNARSAEVERLCLSEAVAKARGCCYLKYLNGAAMVVYGVPIFLAG